MRLGMNRELEAEVMVTICLAKWISNSDLRLTDITQLTEISQPTLQRILPRLEQRGWIKKTEAWINIPPNTMEFPLLYDTKKKRVIEIDYTAQKAFKKAEKITDVPVTYEERKRIAREIKAGYTPRKIIVFKFLDFPYLTGIRNMPLGTKRLWKLASRTVKDYVKEHKLKPFLLKTT